MTQLKVTQVRSVIDRPRDQKDTVRRLGLHRINDTVLKDDRPEIIRERLESYYRQTEPLLEYYRNRGLLYTIDGMGTEDEVFERIRAVVDKVGARK